MAKDPCKLKDYLICMRQIPALSPDELNSAVSQNAQGDLRARRLLEERFLPYVLAWVMPYRGCGLELLPLIEIGNRALLRALRQMKPGPGPDPVDTLENCVVAEVEAAVLRTASR